LDVVATMLRLQDPQTLVGNADGGGSDPDDRWSELKAAVREAVDGTDEAWYWESIYKD